MIPLRTKLIISFAVIVLILGSIATFIGIHLISKNVIEQSQDKVRTDLNSAREIYQREVNEIKIIVRLTAERFYIKDALIRKDYEKLNSEIAIVREREGLDVLNLTDSEGKIIIRSRNPKVIGDAQTQSSILTKTLTGKETFAGTEIIPKEELLKCAPELAEAAYFKFIPTPHAKPTTKTEETSGMMIKHHIIMPGKVR